MSVFRRRTSREERCSSLSLDVETACDALRSIAAGDGCTDRTFVAIRTSFVLGMHESCFILGEKRGLGMVALPLFIRLRL